MALSPQGEKRSPAHAGLRQNHGRQSSNGTASTSRTSASVLYAASVTGTGSHTLQVKVLGTKNARASGKRVDVDAFLVLK